MMEGTRKVTAAEQAYHVTEQRNEAYGPSTEITARLWSAFLDKPVLPEDVALMMVLFKMGRELTQRKDDNLVDMHGYLIVYERIKDAT